MTSTTTKQGFILDFDNTITTKDTISTLFSQVLQYQKSQGRGYSKAYDDIISGYTTDYAAHIENYRPRKENRRTLKEEIAFQRSLKDVESKSFERVSKSGMFKGISDEIWKTLGRQAVATGEIEVRSGFWKSGGDQMPKRTSAILSVNFSRAFIEGVISVHPENCFGDFDSIVSNGQLDSAEGNGVVIGPKLDDSRNIMATSDGKWNAMNKIRQKWQDQGDAIMELIYVGDSGTDIECLTDSSVIGVIMTPDGGGSLMDTMNRVGIEVVHISSFKERQEMERILYWARDFVEIIESPIYRSDY
ncbi:putative hydrolase [Glarea lozoyensis ATCC 20868]|uniref:Putative hydrolase n=1 Tax=Glarea lozoyensis (strain ATCC 20868 / MF5171) TaxID=1116229 RepID=S3DC50_GLAL2|nr:putative hydrolase [Glarea lozoyensis ATCC 20868]EPE29581.1 putative hydrolase [Glarea lozoyensis ATCC 20868]